jgi:hypothetical protein
MSEPHRSCRGRIAIRATLPAVFHLELRHFPTTARVFNLSAEELHRRVLEPWIAGETFEQDERRWDPEKTKLTIYEGPALRSDEIGMGRGWGNVTRTGQEVTDGVLEAARQQSAPSVRQQAIRELKGQLVERVTGRELGFPEVVALAADGRTGWRASDLLAVAEQAVWELLHEGRVAMTRDGAAPVPKPEWEGIVLAWATWATDPGTGTLRLRASG